MLKTTVKGAVQKWKKFTLILSFDQSTSKLGAAVLLAFVGKVKVSRPDSSQDNENSGCRNFFVGLFHQPYRVWSSKTWEWERLANIEQCILKCWILINHHKGWRVILMQHQTPWCSSSQWQQLMPIVSFEIMLSIFFKELDFWLSIFHFHIL